MTVPRLCLLDGIVIWINTRDHAPPHFHARQGGDDIRVELPTLAVLSGRLAPAKQRLLLAWATFHRAELMRNWHLAVAGLPHEAIPPTLEEEAGR
ncbi:MAG: DUF4160 domain-containing protein [Actinomycetales bacterium]